MAAGLPFVTTPVGDGAGLAEASGAGIVTQSDAEALGACLTRLIEHSDLRTAMSIAGKSTAVRYDWDVIGPRFATWTTTILAATR